ncbi:MAG: hypothetical protein Q4P20_10660 [Eubacteriales bacterium]|nr:hypothetical protein [Eubacteriales bacterium]
MKREYNQAMDRVHMSEECARRILEQASSDERKGGSVMKYKVMVQRAVAVVAAAAVVSATALAADVGGIRTSMTMWIHGQQQEVEVEKDGAYGYKTTIDGEERGFGGVAIDEDGNAHPLDETDMQDMYAVDVEQGDDGTWTLYFYDQTIDITKDMENGGYDNRLTHEGTAYHVVVEPDGGFSVSTDD